MISSNDMSRNLIQLARHTRAFHLYPNGSAYTIIFVVRGHLPRPKQFIRVLSFVYSRSIRDRSDVDQARSTCWTSSFGSSLPMILSRWYVSSWLSMCSWAARRAWRTLPWSKTMATSSKESPSNREVSHLLST